VDLKLDVSQPLSVCSIAIQQLIAIARALDVSAKLLVLDEPTSSLDEQEVKELFKVLRKLRTQGMGIVFVTHFLDQVYAISDRITVLRDGRLVGEYETAKLPKVELVSRMIGKDPCWSLHDEAPLTRITNRKPSSNFGS
jgi:simple sugar transport system ATP-binding protein